MEGDNNAIEGGEGGDEIINYQYNKKIGTY
jgi:hypothetical protein